MIFYLFDETLLYFLQDLLQKFLLNILDTFHPFCLFSYTTKSGLNLVEKTITLNNIEFHVLKDIDNNKIEAMSWIEVFKKMFDIINNFKKSSDLSEKY